MKLSAVVIVKSDQTFLPNCLESLKWADELVVVDNGSTDETVKVAKKYTSKVYSFLGQDFAKLRNFALNKALNNWVLFIDSDERVLQPLKNEIAEIVSSSNAKSAYAIPRQNIIFGQPVKYKAFWPDYVMRLIQKDKCSGFIGEVHEYPKITGQTGYLKNPMLHLTHRNVDQVVLKSLDWSNIDAKLRLGVNHPPMTTWRFLRILFTEICNQGIKRRGFFNGSVGTIDALLQTFSLIITYIRLWELQQKIPLNKKYQQIDQKLKEDDFQY